MARRKASGDDGQSIKRVRLREGDEEDKVGEDVREKGPGEEKEKAAALGRRSLPRRAASQSAAATAAWTRQEAATTAALEAVPDAAEIHERVFAPMTVAERETWQGWTDIESEPAFFNSILDALGIRGAKIQEVFAVDEATSTHLENPAGLIFLYEFIEEDEARVREDAPPDSLWFANQTTANACATLAMLNIAMNCPGIHLGDRLTRFKADTQHLHPALRGHLLSTDAFIRSCHNSFARRLDMLSTDMTLKQQWDETQKASRARGNARKKQAKAASSPYEEDDAAFHFIAYVPMGQDVWELNGMQEQGRRLGSFSGGDWTAMARERIAERMLAYAQYDDRAVFSLLAFCQTGARDSQHDQENGHGDSHDSQDTEVDDVARADARKGDYTPAVHCWIKKLAEKGLLQQLVTGQG